MKQTTNALLFFLFLCFWMTCIYQGCACVPSIVYSTPTQELPEWAKPPKGEVDTVETQ